MSRLLEAIDVEGGRLAGVANHETSVLEHAGTSVGADKVAIAGTFVAFAFVLYVALDLTFWILPISFLLALVFIIFVKEGASGAGAKKKK
jgi:hypothetical protein